MKVPTLFFHEEDQENNIFNNLWCYVARFISAAAFIWWDWNLSSQSIQMEISDNIQLPENPHNNKRLNPGVVSIKGKYFLCKRLDINNMMRIRWVDIWGWECPCVLRQSVHYTLLYLQIISQRISQYYAHHWLPDNGENIQCISHLLYLSAFIKRTVWTNL